MMIPDRLTLDPEQTESTYFFGPPPLLPPPEFPLPFPFPPPGDGEGVGLGLGDGAGAGAGDGEGEGEGEALFPPPPPPPPLVGATKAGSKSFTLPFIEDPTFAPSARLAAPIPTPTTQRISAYSDELAASSFLRKLRRREMPFRTFIDCPRLHDRVPQFGTCYLPAITDRLSHRDAEVANRFRKVTSNVTKLTRAVPNPATERDRHGEMVLLGRIELPTSPLPRVRSTTELQQPGARTWQCMSASCEGALLAGPGPLVKLSRTRLSPSRLGAMKRPWQAMAGTLWNRRR